MEQKVDLAGLRLKNPVLTASGTFGYGEEYSCFGELSRLGAIVVKGLSLEERPGNTGRRVAETPCGMLNSVGLQNIGVQRFVQEKLPRLPWKDTPVVVNIYAGDYSEFGELADFLSRQEAVAALEVNISCPNVRAGGSIFGQDPEMAARACSAVRENARGKPVIPKLTPNVSDVTQIATAVQEAGADAVTLINTLAGMAVDIRSRRPVLGKGVGGLSGPAIKPVALQAVYRVCRTVEIPVIGVGGIASAEDALEFILVGASAVQVGSASFADPELPFSLVSDIQELCTELGISSWEEFRGSLSWEGRQG